MTFLQLDLPFIHNPYLQIIIRSLAVYFFMIIAIRVFGKKELAQLSVIDLVFILLISNAVQNAMVGQDTSLGGGLLAALSLFAANFTLKKIMYRYKIVGHWMQGEAILLIYKGKVQEQQCAKAEISIQELEAAVREHGTKNIEQVDLAMLEVDGNISIISNDFQNRSKVGLLKKNRRLRGRNNTV